MPERAAFVMRVAAARSALRSNEGKRDAGRTTKPSWSRDARAVVYGSFVDVFVDGIEEAIGPSWVGMLRYSGVYRGT